MWEEYVTAVKSHLWIAEILIRTWWERVPNPCVCAR